MGILRIDSGRLEREAREEMDRKLSLWLWKVDWNNPSAEDVGRLRTMLSQSDRACFSGEEIKTITRFLDEKNLDRANYQAFLKEFDLFELSGMAARGIIQENSVLGITRTQALNAKMSEDSELELIMDENGEMMECNWVKRSWGGDVRVAVPADAARMIWENAPLFAEAESVQLRDESRDEEREAPKPG